MSKYPEHLILSNKVYNLSVSSTRPNSGRAFDRGLVDLCVKGENPLSSFDKWRTSLGMSEELYKDYTGFGQTIPLEWVLFRFLSHHVRTNSVDILAGSGGEVLTEANFNDYLGKEVTDNEAEQMLRVILRSWVHVFSGKNIRLYEIYVSTDIPIDILRRNINALKFLGHIEEINQDTYKVKPSIFDNLPLSKGEVSLDRKINRYYQEIKIEAVEPFCFVIMPFKEEEFPQRIYVEVIKPLVEDFFNISCYRVDEDRLPDRIDNKIYSYFLRAAFIIAEVTTLNPNVLYELGLAHMLEKDCIILTTTSISKVPFDINRIRAEQYDGDDQLREILKRSISALAFKGKKGFG